MPDNQFSRTELLLGADAMYKLKNSHVIVFGVGGVGGYVIEALTRAGIGSIDIVDNDVVSVTNLNRQIIALHSTIGKYKVDVMKDRVLDINPDININTFKTFYSPETSQEFDFSKYDYVVDAIDNVTGKIELVMQAQKFQIPIISSMGTGDKVNPEMLEISDIYKTSVCPLARVMRQEMKKRRVKKLKVLYSKEVPIKPVFKEGEKPYPSSSSFVPSTAGLIIASQVIKDIINL